MPAMYATHPQHLAGGAVAATVPNETRAYETGWHAHDEYMLLLPRSGGFIVRTEADKALYRLNASCFTMVAPQVRHATAATRPDQRHLAVYADPAYVLHCAQRLGADPATSALARPGVWRNSAAMLAVLRLRDELLAADERIRRARLLDMDRLLATECITAALTTPNVLPSMHVRDALLIHEIQAHIEAHLAERLSLDEVAAQFLLSRRHLTRLFRERAGCSVLDFITLRRVQRAHLLLADPMTTILEASLAVGIESPSYLARLYRRVYGHAPSERR